MLIPVSKCNKNRNWIYLKDVKMVALNLKTGDKKGGFLEQKPPLYKNILLSLIGKYQILLSLLELNTNLGFESHLR
jgi:hypothetical protein